MGETPTILIGMLCIGIVFSIYILNRFTDIQEDYANDVGELLFFQKKPFLYALGVGIFILVIATFVILGKLHSYHLFLFGFGILYSYRLLPWYRKGKGIVFYRLKEIPLAKNIVVSFLWGISIFMIPIMFLDIDTHNIVPLCVLTTAIILSTFNNTLFSDILDELGDRFAHNNTLPVIWGARNCFILLTSIDIVWELFLIGMVYLGKIDLSHYIFLALFGLYPFVCFVSYITRHLHRQAIEFLCESDLLIFATGLLILSVV